MNKTERYFKVIDFIKRKSVLEKLKIFFERYFDISR
jgi:hypothetical protein